MRGTALPSTWLPQRNMRAPWGVIESARRWIDIDIVWDCDLGVWQVLERCENSHREATVNGERLEGWRRAAQYKKLRLLSWEFEPWLRERDVASARDESTWYEQNVGNDEDADLITVNRTFMDLRDEHLDIRRTLYGRGTGRGEVGVLGRTKDLQKTRQISRTPFNGSVV